MSMLAYVPVPVVLPLAVAAVLAGTGSALPRRAIDVVALAVVAVVGVVTLALAVAAARHGSLVYWFGNWHPDARAGSATPFPTGVCFVVEPLGAGFAALVAVLMFAALTFSWAFFEEVKSLFHALMLVFLAAMCGMCLSGDLFNLFVWFELMTAAAVALCGYKCEESAPLLGALNFAIVNTIGAFMTLGGIAIVYAYAGTLNLAEAGRSLAAHPPGPAFVAVAFALCVAGYLVKAAAVPFQFWLADAHAVAPTPVCVLFSGAMVEIGLFAVARLSWTTFAPAFGPHGDAAVRDVFLAMGALTAIVGSCFSFGQRHFKRMLAFATVGHVGLMIVGFALLRGDALAGVATYVVGHGLVKGTLFLCAGMLLHRCGGVDEHDLRGTGRNQWPLGVMMTVAALGLAGLPPFATFYGASMIHDAADARHLTWVKPLGVVVDALTAGAVLRVVARVFLGWGERQEATSLGAPHVPMDRETAADHDSTPAWMWLPAAALLALAGVVAVPASFRADVAGAAEHFTRTTTLAAATLDGRPDPIVPIETHVAAPGASHAIMLAIIALLLALTLRPAMLGRSLNWRAARAISRVVRPLRRLQSGNVGDYVAWLVFGIAAYGGLLVLLSR